MIFQQLNSSIWTILPNFWVNLFFSDDSSTIIHSNLIYCLQNIQIILFSEGSIVLRMRTIQPFADALVFYLMYSLLFGIKSQSDLVLQRRNFRIFILSWKSLDPQGNKNSINNRIKLKSPFIIIFSDCCMIITFKITQVWQGFRCRSLQFLLRDFFSVFRLFIYILLVAAFRF